jgi:hypothetical protein
LQAQGFPIPDHRAGIKKPLSILEKTGFHCFKFRLERDFAGFYAMPPTDRFKRFK